MTTRAFGRLYSPDDRDRRFPMRAMLPRTVEVVSRFYAIGPVLDQGDTSQCVGYSAKQFLQSEPVQTLDGPTATELYKAAQAEDEWPGDNYEGSSVRGAAKALTGMGRLKSYVWAANATDVRDFLITSGTVMMGTDWRSAMTTPVDGQLKVSGAVEGGHAYLLVGYDATTNRFRMVNSWGADWGEHGQAWIRFKDLDRLIAARGEACAALEQALAPVSELDALRASVANMEARISALEQLL